MRQATSRDLKRIVGMARDYHRAISPLWPLTNAEGFFSALIEQDSAFLGINDSGFIAGLIAPHPLSPEWLVASEILWWSEGAGGASLLRGFRAWAHERGAKEIRWSCPPDKDRVRRVFEHRAGLDEVIYSEVTPCASGQ